VAVSFNIMQYNIKCLDVKLIYKLLSAGASAMEQTKDSIERYVEEWSEERPDLDATPLTIVGRISLLANTFSQHTREALRPFRLELWQYDVLAALRRQGEPYELPPTTLAKLGMLTTGAMTNRIDRLEERGLVQRRPDPGDRRSLHVRLTKKGVDLMDRAISARIDSAARSLSSLSDRDSQTLERLLKKLVLSSERSE
jgi:DNA-binding MarR family transcriptional regulator